MSIFINVIANDDIINNEEYKHGTNISGSVIDIAEGSDIEVKVGNATYFTTVGSGGQWNVPIPQADMTTWKDGPLTVTVEADGTTVSKTITIDAQLPVIKFELLEGDLLPNDKPLIIKGTIENFGELNKDNLKEYDFQISVGADQGYRVVVENDGTWWAEINVPLPKGVYEQEITFSGVSFSSGNIVDKSLSVVVSTSKTGLIVNPFAGDNVLDANEVLETQLVGGKVVGAGNGGALYVSIDGQQVGEIITFTKGQGNVTDWGIAIEPQFMLSLSQGDHQLRVIFAPPGRKPVVAVKDLIFTVTNDPSASKLAIDPIAGNDGYLTPDEAKDLKVISGWTHKVSAGKDVSISIGDKFSGTTKVSQDGKWQLDLQPGQLASLIGDELTQYTLVVKVLGDDGNTLTVEQHFNAGPSDTPISPDQELLYINVITGDNHLTQAEINQGLEISGWTQKVAAGQEVTVILNGKAYGTLATVQQDGKWSVSISADTLQQLGEQLLVEATVVSISGKELTGQQAVTVEQKVPTITIGVIAGDDYLTPDEAEKPLVINGTTEHIAVGEEIQFYITSKLKILTKAKVQADGSWQATFEPNVLKGLLIEGKLTPHTLTAMLVDSNGIPIAIDERDFNAGYSNKPVPPDTEALVLNKVNAENHLIHEDLQKDLTISGWTQGVPAGAVITITLNGKPYTTTSQITVGEGGEWSATILAAALQGLNSEQLTIAVQTNGNTGTKLDDSQPVTVELAPRSITIESIAGDDYLTVAESKTAQEITGKSDYLAGKTVLVSIKGGDELGQAVIGADGNWKISVGPDKLGKLIGKTAGEYTIVAKVVELPDLKPAEKVLKTAPEAPPTIKIDDITGDNYLDANEAKQPQVISGKSTGLAEGTAVEVSLASGEKLGTAYVKKDGSWSTDFPSAVMKDLVTNGPKDNVVVATAKDGQGSYSDNKDFKAGEVIPPSITMDRITGDNYLSVAESKVDQVIKGKTEHLAAGQGITVSTGATVLGTTTVKADGSWEVTVSSSQLSKLLGTSQAQHVVVAKIDSADAKASQTLQTAALGKISLSINVIAGDDYISVTESKSNQTISGKTTNAGEGSLLELSLSDGTKLGNTRVGKDGSWSHILTTTQMSKLMKSSSASYTLIAKVQDYSGEWTGTERKFKTAGVSTASLSIDRITGDDYLDSNEAKSSQTITGTSKGLAGQTVDLFVLGYFSWGKTKIAANGTWAVTVSSKELSRYVGENTAWYTLSARAEDSYGNHVSKERSFQTGPAKTPTPTLSIGVIAGDDHLSVTESKTSQVISGTSTSLAGRKVTISVAGKDLGSTTINSDGSWKLTLSADKLGQFMGSTAGNYKMIASVSENGVSASDYRYFKTDAIPSGSITMNAITGDDYLTVGEASTSQKISGSTLNVPAGTLVTLRVDGGEILGTATTNPNGVWQVEVTSAKLQSLMRQYESQYKIIAQAKDQNGNVFSDSRTLTTGPTIKEKMTITQVATPMGDYLSVADAEKYGNIVIRGQALGIGRGKHVAVTVGDKISTGCRTMDGEGTWYVIITRENLAKLFGTSETSYTVVAKAQTYKGPDIVDSRVLTLEGKPSHASFSAASADFEYLVDTDSVVSKTKVDQPTKTGEFSALSQDDLGLAQGKPVIELSSTSAVEQLSIAEENVVTQPAVATQPADDSNVVQPLSAYDEEILQLLALGDIDQDVWELAARSAGEMQLPADIEGDVSAEQLPVIDDNQLQTYLYG